MVLLIREDCPFCEEFRDIDKKYPNTFVFKVNNGLVDIGDGVPRPVDKKIETLPALIMDNAVYMNLDGIRHQIKLLEKSLGEQNAII